MTPIINDDDFIKKANGAKPDSIKANIPASELWLFANKQTLDMIETGMSQCESVNIGSFAE